VEEKDYASARLVLKKALEAPAAPGRELADSGRRAEIRELRSQLDER